jgi:hypothetical protein
MVVLQLVDQVVAVENMGAPLRLTGGKNEIFLKST